MARNMTAIACETTVMKRFSLPMKITDCYANKVGPLAFVSLRVGTKYQITISLEFQGSVVICSFHKKFTRDGVENSTRFTLPYSCSQRSFALAVHSHPASQPAESQAIFLSKRSTTRNNRIKHMCNFLEKQNTIKQNCRQRK